MPSFTTVFLKCARSFNICIISFNPFLPAFLFLFFSMLLPGCWHWVTWSKSHTVSWMQIQNWCETFYFPFLFYLYYFITNFTGIKEKLYNVVGMTKSQHKLRWPMCVKLFRRYLSDFIYYLYYHRRYINMFWWESRWFRDNHILTLFTYNPGWLPVGVRLFVDY